MKDEVPKSDVNKEYYTQNMEREVYLLAKTNRIFCGLFIVIILQLP